MIYKDGLVYYYNSTWEAVEIISRTEGVDWVLG